MTLVVLRKGVTIAFGLMLLLGMLLSVAVLSLSLDSRAFDAGAQGIVAGMCAVITILYGWVFAVRGISFVTPFLYVLSCAVVGMTLLPALTTLARITNPGDAAAAGSLLVLLTSMDALIVGLAFAWAWWRPSWKAVLE